MRFAIKVLLLCAAIRAGADGLPEEVARVLQGHAIPAEALSAVVQALDAEQPLVSHLADVPRNPASVMKLVTSWVALEVLGPSYAWPTEVYFLGDFDGRTLDGDLAIKGYGDPYLVIEELWKLLGALRRVGLSEIRGDLVLDHSFFADTDIDPGFFDGQPYRPYNVAPSALLVNFKAVRFEFFAEPGARAVRIAADPALSNLNVRNEIELVDGPCRGYQAGISFHVMDPATAARVVFSGEFAESCGHYAFTRAVLQHDSYLFGLFDTLWQQLGGRLRGRLRAATLADGLEPALTWRSPPLADVLRNVNKNSNNVMTRQLLYTLGAEVMGAPGTQAKGVRAIEDHLLGRQFDIASLSVDNGSGLSREARISAHLLRDILMAAFHGVYGAEFASSLSLGGWDGTTRGRFEGRPEAGRMHVKTGRLDHVAALAGYLHSASGRPYVVVALLNAPDAHRGPGEEVQDALLSWAYKLP